MAKIKNKESVIVVIGKENIATSKILDSVIEFGRHKENIYFLKN
tara:strand:- start:628 stop:759 length:132 start_codon:yes stop_codon:yes gene_type:complete